VLKFLSLGFPVKKMNISLTGKNPVNSDTDISSSFLIYMEICQGIGTGGKII
jgi:hypothetical protein